MADEEPKYRGGCRRGMPYSTDTEPACHRNCLHRAMVQAYYDQRDARDALRESGELVPSSFAFGADVAYYQLEDDDFDAAVPRVTFKQWLEDYWAAQREDQVA